MSRLLGEFFAAVEEEFGVPMDADAHALHTPGAVIAFVLDNTRASDGMDDDEHREHVTGVVGEIIARTLGVTRYAEDSDFVRDLHVR